MDINFFAQHYSTPGILLPAILKEWRPYYQLEAFKDYNPQTHKITSPIHRPDKTIKVPTDEKDKEGNVIFGNKYEAVTRIPLSYQKLIVAYAVAFLTNGDLTLKAKKGTETEAELAKLVQDTWDNNKLDYENGEVAETVMSQLECAEIWYSQKVLDGDGKTIDGKMKVRFYKPCDGYGLIPVWDDNMDLLAFGLQYEDSKNQRARYMDLYDKEQIQYFVQKGAGWELRSDKPPVKHLYGKIPVIFWTRNNSEWWDVQGLIDRIEKVMSVYGDNNEYTGNPILFAKNADDVTMPNKGDAGKFMQGTGEADLKFIERNGKPEPIIFEKDFLKESIYSLTQTPDLSFESMKGLGDVSGAALERLLISAHLKAIRGHRGWYGKNIQRRINFLISALSNITPRLESAKNTAITPVFGLFKLEADSDRVDIALRASGNAPIMSQREAIIYANISDDADETQKEIGKQIKADSAKPANQGE